MRVGVRYRARKRQVSPNPITKPLSLSAKQIDEPPRSSLCVLCVRGKIPKTIPQLSAAGKKRKPPRDKIPSFFTPRRGERNGQDRGFNHKTWHCQSIFVRDPPAGEEVVFSYLRRQFLSPFSPSLLLLPSNAVFM